MVRSRCIYSWVRVAESSSSSRTGPRRRPGARFESTPGGFELSTLQELGIGGRTQAVLDRLGIDTPVPVQIKAIQSLLGGRDAVIEAPTGSGKTLAYLLPMVERLTRPGPDPRALVVTPVRELAIQVDAVYRTLGAAARPAALYGGVGYGVQLDALWHRPTS